LQVASKISTSETNFVCLFVCLNRFVRLSPRNFNLLLLGVGGWRSGHTDQTTGHPEQRTRDVVATSLGPWAGGMAVNTSQHPGGQQRALSTLSFSNASP
jgi:hypothetical protein